MELKKKKQTNRKFIIMAEFKEKDKKKTVSGVGLTDAEYEALRPLAIKKLRKTTKRELIHMAIEIAIGTIKK